MDFFYIDKTDRFDLSQVRTFLKDFDLTYEPQDVDATLAVYNGMDIVATGSVKGNIIRNIAISPSMQGEGLLAGLIQRLHSRLEEQGLYHFFVYTKPSAAPMFLDLGYHTIASVEGTVCFLEFGNHSIGQYLADVKGQLAGRPTPCAGLVMNCNPFTLGHQYLIEQAAAKEQTVVVFVVSEDSSHFSFADRFAMVQAGTAHLDNVVVVPTGPYAVSQATFPTYFLKNDRVELAQTQLDATVFATQTAPTLHIHRRYVGTEPTCKTTAAYNASLATVLPVHGIELVELPRKETAHTPISASVVRALLAEGNTAVLAEYLPQTTLAYLKT